MDREALRVRLEAKSNDAIEESLDAMEAGSLTNIIGGTEMQVREIMERLKRDIYQELVQARIEDVEAAAKRSFSPSASTGGAGAAGAVAG